MSAQLIASLITMVVMLHLFLGAISYIILLERKIAAWVQHRLGPNRTGLFWAQIPGLPKSLWGLGQPIADAIKNLVKEDFVTKGSDKILFILAPGLAVIPALIGWVIIPFGGYMTWGDTQILIGGAPINIGIIFVLATGSLAVYGIVLGGFASNNKYSFLGGLRATAQMVSYEIPLGMTVLIIILMYGTARADYLIEFQAGGVWNIFYQPILAIMFFICGLAECNRAPFDLAECEQELVGGFHTEYSSMKFALFFMGEYFHMITSAGIFTLLFLGGWDIIPFVKTLPAMGDQTSLLMGLAVVFIKIGVFVSKIGVLLALVMVIRWSLPRFRFDQLMRLAWQSLIPICMIMLILTGLVVFFGLNRWWLLPGNVAVVALIYVIMPYLPTGPAVNRRVQLEGSRFCPPATATVEA
ncbi:NADH-quinone oxidoreductase subunit H [bacterium AH-315-I18]|nr:NADH-quinone oxidoreductase subunit H [Phycisphaeraceae bacterium]MBN4060966.1 NADH-quinone oxidoreductase subunit H [bacterium AH-315-I18]